MIHYIIIKQGMKRVDHPGEVLTTQGFTNFIGLDLNSFEFVEGETTETLERSKYFLKFTNF